LRRLFSTFARGWPGVGLLLLRVVAGVALIQQAASILVTGVRTGPAILQVLAAGTGVLLLAGLWTPLAGGVMAIIELWNAFSRLGDPPIYVVLASLGAALALLGPGAWSVDARLFGWKRISPSD
jgi:putative oxidoreductase